LYAARRELYTVVGEIFRERRGRPAQHYDLLEMLLEARDEETGEGMMDQQVRDEVLTLLLAGHETTANALSWTFLLPAQHPHVEVRLQEEYQRVLNGHPAVIEDLPQLPYTRMVIEEAMRLYPPAWGLGRRALGNDVIDGYFIPKGAYVLLFPYVTHRHPAFWEQPDAFDPERFSAGQVAERPRFAYFPFGGGPRLCLGNQFALYEAQLILATILSRYQFLAPDQAYQKLERIRAVAEQAGRNPDEITYGYNVPILVEEGAVTNRWRVAGSAGKVATQLAAIVRHGFTFVNVWPVGEATIQRERLAREVLPAVRDLLA
jgi:cytochrome P450